MPYRPMLTGPRRDVCNLAISAEVRGAEPSAPRPSYHSFGRPITYRHHHLAEPSAPMPTPWAEPLPLITTTIWPSHQHRGQHHGLSHYYQSPLLLGQAVSAEANTMGRAIYTDITPAPIPLGPSVSIATAVQPAHPSEIPTISHGPI